MVGIESWIIVIWLETLATRMVTTRIVLRAPYEGQNLDFRFEVDGHNLVLRNLSLMQSSFDMLMVGPGGGH